MLRVSHLLRASGWRHALGEFALIVVGVLVALWVNDWNQARVDRHRERTDLQQLLATTRENERLVRTALARDSLSLSSARRLMAALEAPAGSQPVRPDSLAAWRRVAFKFASFSPLTGTYAALAQTGELNLLRNAELRAQVATYAGELGGDTREMNVWFQTFNRNVEELIRTLPLPDLRALDDGRTSSLAALRQEDLERSLITQSVISRARMDILYRLLDNTSALRRALEEELRRRYS